MKHLGFTAQNDKNNQNAKHIKDKNNNCDGDT